MRLGIPTVHGGEDVNERKHKEWVDEALSCFPNFQGEMAQLYAEWEWQSIVDSKPEDAHLSYASILEELKSRGGFPLFLRGLN